MAAGHKVDLVAMVDPPTVNARPVPRAILGPVKPMVSPNLLLWTYRLMCQLEAFFKASTSEKIAKLLKRLSGQITNLNTPASADAWLAISIAMAQYLPAPLEVPVTFYAAGYDGRAWRLSSQLEVIEVPGGHSDCMTIGAKLLVDHLRQRIDVLADRAPPERDRERPR